MPKHIRMNPCWLKIRKYLRLPKNDSDFNMADFFKGFRVCLLNLFVPLKVLTKDTMLINLLITVLFLLLVEWTVVLPECSLHVLLFENSWYRAKSSAAYEKSLTKRETHQNFSSLPWWSISVQYPFYFHTSLKLSVCSWNSYNFSVNIWMRFHKRRLSEFPLQIRHWITFMLRCFLCKQNSKERRLRAFVKFKAR